MNESDISRYEKNRAEGVDLANMQKSIGMEEAAMECVISNARVCVHLSFYFQRHVIALVVIE